MFKKITHISDLEPTIAAKPEIRFLNQSHDTKVACYMISEPNTFDDYFARECRGITFDKNGKIVSRSLHKFFNVGEREETLVHNLDWSSVTRIMDKLDGSNIHGVNIDGKMIMKSKKSFDSDVAVAAEKWLKSDVKDSKQINFLNEWCIISKLTPTYEWTSPDARIVLQYDESQLRLLHIRENISGRYFTKDELESVCEIYRVKKVDEIDVSNFNIDYYLDLVKTIEGIEGWIIQFISGEMVKLKTKWYIDRHHVMTNLRTRDIVKAVLNESIDDIKGKLVQEGLDISRILEIEKDVIDRIKAISRIVELTCKQLKDIHKDDRKSIAEEAKKHQYFGMIMQLYSGREPDYSAYFDKYFTSDYDLQTINFTDSVAEIE